MKDSQGATLYVSEIVVLQVGVGRQDSKEHSETEGETMIISDSKRLQDTPRYSLVGRLAGKRRIAVRK